MKRKLHITRIILRFLWAIAAIVLAVVMIKCTFMRYEHTIVEGFMGLLAIISAGTVIFTFFSDEYADYVPIAIPSLTIFFGLVYNWDCSCNIYNVAIITAAIETVIGIAIILLTLQLSKKDPPQDDEKKDDGTITVDITIS